MDSYGTGYAKYMMVGINIKNILLNSLHDDEIPRMARASN